MEWKISFDDKDWKSFEWVEYHKSEELRVELIKYKEKDKKRNKNRRYRIRSNGEYRDVINQIKVPQNAVHYSTEIDYIVTDDLDTALEMIEEMKNKIK